MHLADKNSSNAPNSLIWKSTSPLYLPPIYMHVLQSYTDKNVAKVNSTVANTATGCPIYPTSSPKS